MSTVTEINVIVRKGRVSRKFDNGQITYGVTATLEEGEDWKEEARKLSAELKTMVGEELPSPGQEQQKLFAVK